LEAWLARIPEAVRQQIRVATADRKRGYATILARWCPQVGVVADPFQAQALSRWLRNAEAGEHAEGRVGAGLIRLWRREILAHWAQPQRWTNGFIEGVHTKIKHLKRVSYGCRNRDRSRREMWLGFLPPSRIPHFLT
jgi:transposase